MYSIAVLFRELVHLWKRLVTILFLFFLLPPFLSPSFILTFIPPLNKRSVSMGTHTHKKKNNFCLTVSRVSLSLSLSISLSLSLSLSLSRSLSLSISLSFFLSFSLSFLYIHLSISLIVCYILRSPFPSI